MITETQPASAPCSLAGFTISGRLCFAFRVQHIINKQLVAYIHLNPLRAGMVQNIVALKTYPFSGHSALMGKRIRPWQDTEFVLALFGRTVSEARRNLQEYLSKWSAKGRCPELTGGGLIRSAGGWHAVKEAYGDGIRISGDERILGSSDFVETTLKHSGEVYGRRLRMKRAGIDLAAVVAAVCHYLQVGEKELESTTRRIEIARARALVSHIALGSCRSREAKSLFDSISTVPPSAGQRTGSAMMRTSPQPSRPSLLCSCRLQVNNETTFP
jgi:hypothetical protein